ADARQRDRLRRRSREPPPRPECHLGTRGREASDAQRRRDHREGFRARPRDRGVGALAAGDRRSARGQSQEVRPERRPALSSADARVSDSSPTPRHVLFVTGRLAEPALRTALAGMAPPFAYTVAPLKITVAALMTTPWIARFLKLSAPDVDLVMIPG